MAGSSKLDAVYATDEDMFNEGGDDYFILVPKSNVIASGKDGVFDPSDRWTLVSGGNDFEAQGVAAGMMLRITGPSAFFNQPRFLAVDSASGDSASLRVPGQAAGVGMPPSPEAGCDAVQFDVLTFGPQIEAVAFELNEAYNVDPRIVNRRPEDMYDRRVFRRLTCLMVYYRGYARAARGKDGYDEKIAFYRAEYEGQLSAAIVRWGVSGVDQPPSGPRFGRLSR